MYFTYLLVKYYVRVSCGVKMTRPKIGISMSVNLTLLGDMPERMWAVQKDGETRLNFIRVAINNEIARRNRIKNEAENNRTVPDQPSHERNY